ncbi:GT4_PimA-like domain containing protein [Candidatus Methylopumilus universalis]|uniref:glycosyltransferase n=1 Tax=Candidatus Methylopumilus universalis TaxID=2588536 RepID=UPI003BEF3353
MIIKNKKRLKIAHFGAFDHDSYGDLIFPFIVEHFLPEFDFIHISPSGKSTLWSDAKKTISINDAFNINDWDGVLVGGGDIVQYAEGFVWNDSALQSLGALASLWSGASLLSAKLDIPCAWNSPGVPADLPDPTLSMSKNSIECVDYLAVRDNLSADRISRLINHPLHIVPDTALVINEIWKKNYNFENKSKPLILSLTPKDLEKRVDEIELLIRKVTIENGLSGDVVILPLMEWQKSTPNHKFEKLKNEFNVLVKNRTLTLQECALEISKGGAYVGNSLHGLITALSYGVPAVHVRPEGYESVTKYQGFANHFPSGNQILAKNFIEASNKLAEYQIINIDKAVQTIKDHFGHIRNVLIEKNNSKKSKWGEIAKASDLEAQDLLLHGYSVYQLLNNRNKNINERDQQIGVLNQSVNERELQLNQLNKSILERDGKITNLNHQISSRDKWTLNLDKEIIRLNDEVFNRGEWGLRLNKEIDELKEEIFRRGEWGLSLNRQIDELNEEIERRGVWALSLERANEEKQKTLDDIVNSFYWKMTSPLRWLVKIIRSPKSYAKSFALTLLNRSFYLFRRLPINLKNKLLIKSFILRYLPNLKLIKNEGFQSLPVIDSSIRSNKQIEIEKINPESYPEILKTINLPFFKKPFISIIIPIYGKINYTLNCLRSISLNLPNTSFEIIVINDNSPDDSLKTLRKIKNIRILNNKLNQGFIFSCNKGAKAASGKYLYFLNNDTEVTPGWLDALLQTFTDFPKTGIVGSKLIYPDGTLQEAGGIIWKDGSAWNFGRGQDPHLPVFNYAREVDYCSGASIVLPKKLFWELGGFDEHYLPAYCEDSDLALKLRSQGYRVIYQPLSTVIHFEGMTSGTDTSSGIKSYQVTNLQKQYKRWKLRLLNHQVNGKDVDQAKDRNHSFRVLYIDETMPTPDKDAGSVTAYNLMILLRSLGAQVTFIPINLFNHEPYTKNLQKIGIEVLYSPFIKSIEEHLLDKGSRYNLAIVSRPSTASLVFDDIKKYCKNIKIIYNSVDIHFLRMGRQLNYDSNIDKHDVLKMKLLELSLIKKADASLILSQEELRIISKDISEKKLYLMPLMLRVKDEVKTFRDRRNFLFIGGFLHQPNIDAAIYFVKEIMPILRKSLPGANFLIIGSHPPKEILDLAAKDIKVLGYVPDISKIFDQIRLSVTPIRYGAGIKGKIGTSMAFGVPVVSTSIGAEGMGLKNKKNLIIADTPEDFAVAVGELYKSHKVWQKISKESLLFAKKSWSEEVILKLMKLMLKDLKINIKKDSYPVKFYT